MGSGAGRGASPSHLLVKVLTRVCFLHRVKLRIWGSKDGCAWGLLLGSGAAGRLCLSPGAGLASRLEDCWEGSIFSSLFF